MFGKKKNQYNEAQKEMSENKLAASRIVTELMTDDDERARELVDLLKDGHPLIINFEELDRFSANKFVAFFIGACYAVDGKTMPISSKIFLFARRVDLLDGSVKKFVDDIPTS